MSSVRGAQLKRSTGAQFGRNGLPKEKNDLLKSVQRACDILALIAEERRPLKPRDISELLGYNVATCYHLLNTLEHAGYLHRDRERYFRLGEKIGELYGAYSDMLEPDPRLMTFLDLLNTRTGETTYLGGWDGEDVVSMAVREGRRSVRVKGVPLGYREHAYARALGLVLIAYREEEFIDAYLERTELESLTEHTVIDPVRLRTLLAEVRKSGVAIEREQFVTGVCCVAGPVRGRDGHVVAGLSVSVPKARFDRDENAIVAAVRETTTAASEIFS